APVGRGLWRAVHADDGAARRAGVPVQAVESGVLLGRRSPGVDVGRDTRCPSAVIPREGGNMASVRMPTGHSAPKKATRKTTKKKVATKKVAAKKTTAKKALANT